jgi:UDP-glucose 4-epimerase
VTGGAGFIGSHVVNRFLSAGDRVVVVDDLSTGKRANLVAGVEFYETDVAGPEATRLIAEGNFQVVAHLAAQIDVRKSINTPRLDADINIGGTLNLLEAIRTLPAPARPRMIFASTAGLYGDSQTLPTPETASTNPDAPYGVAKLAAEYYLAYYSRVWGVESVVLRFGNVFGPRQDAHGEAGVVAILASRANEGPPMTIYGDGKQTRDYIYVADVAEAFHAASVAAIPAAATLDSRAFNVGTGVETSVLQLADVMNAIVGKKSRVELAPRREGEIIRSLLAPDKAERMLGWKARVPLREGLEHTVAWVRGAAGSSSSGSAGERPATG